MNIIKKISKAMLAIFMSLTVLGQFQMVDVYAAGYSANPAVSTITVGQSTTVTVTVSGYTGRFDVSGAVSDSFWCDGSTSKTYNVTGASVGTINVTVTSVNASDDAGNMASGSDTASIKVVAAQSGGNDGGNGSSGGNSSGGNNSNGSTNNTPNTPTTPTEKKSSDASLFELTISEGTLSPEFSADTTEYSVSLEKDKSSITINAKANDAKASVSGTGEHTVKAGSNDLEVICTAEDGTSRTYKIKVSVDETPTSFITYNDKKLGVVKDTSSLSIPSGFEEVKVTLDGSEVTAWKNPLNNLIIVYMIDDKNEKNFYLYDEASKNITSIYKPMALLGRNIAVIDIPSELQTKEGLTYKEVEIDGVKLMGWSFNDEKLANYSLLYVMDEQGKLVYYLYEKSENTLQLYSNQAAISQDAYETLLNDHDSALQQRMLMIIALLITNIITIGLIIVMVLKRKKHVALPHTSNRKVMDNEDPMEVTELDDMQGMERDITFIHEEGHSQPDEVEDTSLHIKPYENQEHLFDEEK